ncbi:MAG: class I SAM-dependent methyltransferase [Acidimicrobiales bacterium]
MADPKHWDAAYETKGSQGVSWYQSVPKVSLDLIRRIEVVADTPVIDVGGGEALFVDNLLTQGFSDLTVLDLSTVALNEARRRVGSAVRWVHADVRTWDPDRTYGLWHDRAVFHFLVDPDDRAAYVRTLMAATTPGSAVIVATFAPAGPETCSGLPVARYSSPALAEALGPRFHLLVAEQEQHTTPSGAIQPFTWVAGRLT